MSEREGRGRRHRVPALVAVVLLLGAGGAALALRSDPSTRPASEGAAPTLAFERFDGSEGSVADYRGKPLVVNFWASWCPPCVAEMPEFEKLHQRHGDRVAFLGIGTQDSPEDAARIVDLTGVTYDLARDPDGALFRVFGVFGMPSTFFVTPDGEILSKHTGIIDPRTLEQRIDELLGEL